MVTIILLRITGSNMRKAILYIVTVACLSRCTSGERLFETRPSKEQRSVSQFKLDGVYVGKQLHSSEFSVSCFIFYNNGVAVIYDPIYYVHDITNRDLLQQQIKYTVKFDDSTYRKKESGGFNVNGDLIKIQLFRISGGGIYGLCEYNGRIINDSTIYIANCKFSENPNSCRENFYLHFMKMNKPDSTNYLMQKKWYWKD
jgi:hypothetical protein